MAWPKKAHDNGTLAAPEFDSPVATIEPEIAEFGMDSGASAEPITQDEAELLDMLEAQARARKLKSEKFFLDKAARQAKELEREAAEQKAIEDAAAELARIRAEKDAQEAHLERGRVAKVLADWDAEGHLQVACDGAVRQYDREAQFSTAPVEACRSILEDRLQIPAPPAECWTMSDPLFWEVKIAGGRATISVSAQPGQEPPLVMLTVSDEQFVGTKAIVITDRAALGNWLRENHQAGPALGVSVRAPEPVAMSDDAFLGQFGLGA